MSDKRKLLFVEGKDEVHFCIHLMKYSNSKIEFSEKEKEGCVTIVDIEGRSKLKERLEEHLRDAPKGQFGAIGIILDAEEQGAKSTLSDIQRCCKNNDKIFCPKKLGVVEIQRGLRVGAFVMPDNKKDGMLETLCLESRKDPFLDSCICHYIDCVEKEWDKKVKRKDKTRLLSYLAVQDDPTSMFSRAFQEGYLNPHHKDFNDIKKFLEELFIENAT